MYLMRRGDISETKLRLVPDRALHRYFWYSTGRGTAMPSWSACSSYCAASFQFLRYDVKPVRGARHARVYSQTPAHGGYTASQDWKSANPDFDDIELDEDYYRSLGISEEELADQLAFLASDADPLGEELSPEGLGNQQQGAVSYLMDEDMNETTWGPQAILLAGFKAEECAIIRCILDSAGSDVVKVIPCTSDMLYLSVENGLNEPEVDWSQPRPEGWSRGREWGSQRVILFSGLSGAAVLTIVELLEEAGLPPLCIAMAEETDAQRVVGEVLAEAIKAQRGRKTPQKHVWELPGHASRRLPDLEELIGEQARERTQAFQGQPQQQQEPQQQEQEPLASSSPLQAPTELSQVEPATASTSHPTESPSIVAAATARQPQHQHAPAAAHPATEHITDAAGSMDMAGAMSVEETQASQHSQAMAPGIDALRRRRAAVLQQQQQQSPGEDGMPLPPQQAPLTNGHAEPQHASAEQNSVSTGDQVQAVAQTASHQQANHTGRFQDEALDASRDSPVDLPLHTESDDTAWTGAVAEPHAGDTSDVSSSREEHPLMKAVTNGDQADYDSLLDAIASGSLDWEPPAQQASSSQASEQQLNTHHHMQTRLPSQEPASDSTKLPQHTWHEQAEAMPSNPADTPLQHPDTAPAPAAAAPGQQPVTPSLPTATPGSTHQHSTTEASQRAAEAQDLANSGQSQQPAEAADQAWPWEDGKGADTPALSADIVARSGSRLRLRTASSSARRPQKQSSRKVASRSQTPSNLLSPKGTASQGAVQETEWRVTNSQQTTAEEFVKRPADLDNQRPVWAASAAVPAGAGVEAAQHEAGSRQSPPPSESRPLTKQELRALAARQGLDYDRLLADALSRGIPMSD